MKINWGTGIVIGMLCFMAFILQYVIRVQTDSKYENELVTEQYYEKEIEMDGNYQKAENLNDLGNKFQILTTSEGILVQFPEDFDYHNIQGNISLYRPSDQKMDTNISIELSSSAMLIPKNALADGRWDIIVDWQYNQQQYYKKESIIL